MTTKEMIDVTCKHNDNGTADPLNGLCVNCEGFNNWEKDA